MKTAAKQSPKAGATAPKTPRLPLDAISLGEWGPLAGPMQEEIFRTRKGEYWLMVKGKSRKISFSEALSWWGDCAKGHEINGLFIHSPDLFDLLSEAAKIVRVMEMEKSMLEFSIPETLKTELEHTAKKQGGRSFDWIVETAVKEFIAAHPVKGGAR